MKKYLLTTTAIALFSAGSAVAKGPTVTVGGYADFQLGIADQDAVDIPNLGVFDRDYHTRTDTEVHIKVDGKTDSGLGYGAYIELEADVNADDTTGANNDAERTYIYVESGFGRVELGANGSASGALGVSAATFARATGGVGGDFYQYVDLDGSANDRYYILPGLTSDVGLPGEASRDGVTDSAFAGRTTANKITYYSPRLQGVQLGLSYTPDQDERGTGAGFSGESDATGIEDVWNLGLNYRGSYDDLSIEASFTAEWGEAEAAANDDLESYAFGLNGSYAGFTFGGSLGLSDEYGQTAADDKEAFFWTLGGAYEFGPFAASVTYLASEIENGTSANADSEFSNLSVGADYQLAPGLVPYVEVNFFDTDDNSTGADNDGTVFIVGTELNF